MRVRQHRRSHPQLRRSPQLCSSESSLVPFLRPGGYTGTRYELRPTDEANLGVSGIFAIYFRDPFSRSIEVRIVRAVIDRDTAISGNRARPVRLSAGVYIKWKCDI